VTRAREPLTRLFEDLAAGSTQALDGIYESCADEVYGLALWCTGSASDAADVVQEVFVRLASRRSRLGGIRDPRAYVRSMTYRASIDVHRKRTRRREEPLETCPLVEAPGESPERRLDAVRVSRLLERLPANQRQTIFLRHRRTDLHRGQSLPARHAAVEASDRSQEMRPKNDRDLFGGQRVPRAPADLRQRVLRAATDAMTREEPPSIWDRIWESRALGRSWATVTLGLLVAHAALALLSDSPDSAGDLRSVERRHAREVRRMLDLPAVEISPSAAALALGGRSRSEKPTTTGGSNPPSRS